MHDVASVVARVSIGAVPGAGAVSRQGLFSLELLRRSSVSDDEREEAHLDLRRL